MDLKTEYDYNEDNFIEQGGELKELTVTITLCEYRNLIEERCYNEKAIEILQEENQKLTEQNKSYAEYIVSKNPDIIKQLGCAINGFFNTDVAQGDTEQPEEEKENENGAI